MDAETIEAFEHINQLPEEEKDAVFKAIGRKMAQEHPLKVPTLADIQWEVLKLLRMNKKKKAKKFAERDMAISINKLVALFLHCEMSPFPMFTYRRKVWEWIPDHLKEPDGSIDLGIRDNPSSMFEKASRLFEERDFVSAHLLMDSDSWHIFFWKLGDLRGNQYEGGPHIHYTSSLCHPQTPCGLFWQEFENYHYKVGNSFHIRVKS